MNWELTLKSSAINHASFCFGSVFHRRLKPRVHAFKYSMFMPLVDLSQLDAIDSLSRLVSRNKFNIYSFVDSDYLKPFLKDGESLEQRAKRVCLSHLQNPSAQDKDILDADSGVCNQVLMLSQWRFFGRVFNPISVFYFFHDGQLSHVMAEVSNTPWNERHVYSYAMASERVSQQSSRYQWRDDKSFHVSPFNPMDMMYDWDCTVNQTQLALCLSLKQGNELIFQASFNYERTPFDQRGFKKGMVKQPIFSFSTVFGIYWQALKLAIKRIPFYSHPKTS